MNDDADQASGTAGASDFGDHDNTARPSTTTTDNGEQPPVHETLSDLVGTPLFDVLQDQRDNRDGSGPSRTNRSTESAVELDDKDEQPGLHTASPFQPTPPDDAHLGDGRKTEFKGREFEAVTQAATTQSRESAFLEIVGKGRSHLDDSSSSSDEHEFIREGEDTQRGWQAMGGRGRRSSIGENGSSGLSGVVPTVVDSSEQDLGGVSRRSAACGNDTRGSCIQTETTVTENRAQTNGTISSNSKNPFCNETGTTRLEQRSRALLDECGRFDANGHDEEMQELGQDEANDSRNEGAEGEGVPLTRQEDHDAVEDSRTGRDGSTEFDEDGTDDMSFVKDDDVSGSEDDFGKGLARHINEQHERRHQLQHQQQEQEQEQRWRSGDGGLVVQGEQDRIGGDEATPLVRPRRLSMEKNSELERTLAQELLGIGRRAHTFLGEEEAQQEDEYQLALQNMTAGDLANLFDDDEDEVAHEQPGKTTQANDNGACDEGERKNRNSIKQRHARHSSQDARDGLASEARQDPGDGESSCGPYDEETDHSADNSRTSSCADGRRSRRRRSSPLVEASNAFSSLGSHPDTSEMSRLRKSSFLRSTEQRQDLVDSHTVEATAVAGEINHGGARQGDGDDSSGGSNRGDHDHQEAPLVESVYSDGRGLEDSGKATEGGEERQTLFQDEEEEEEHVEERKDENDNERRDSGGSQIRKRKGPGPIVMNTSQCEYAVVRECAVELGWQLCETKFSRQNDPLTTKPRTDGLSRQNNTADASYACTHRGKCNKLWNVMWHDHGNFEEHFHGLQSFQQFSHLPGLSFFARKVGLAMLMSRMYHEAPKEYRFYPETWVLPVEMSDFRAEFGHRGTSKSVFIIKPDSGCQGKGIFLTKELNSVTALQGKSVAQRYLRNPLLIDGYKFDLRLYVLVTNINPLRIFLFNDGLVRICTEPFEAPTEKNLNKTTMHLTNYSVNKASSNFTSDEMGEGGFKRSVKWFKKWVHEQGHDSAALWARLADACVKTLITVGPMLRREYHLLNPTPMGAAATREKPIAPSGRGGSGGGRGGGTSTTTSSPAPSKCFTIIGMDLMIDDELEPWIIEINHLPSFRTETGMDYRIKKELVFNTLSLLDVRVGAREEWLQEMERLKRIRLFGLGSDNGGQKGNGLGETGRGSPRGSPKTSPRAKTRSRMAAARAQEDHENAVKGGFERIFPPSRTAPNAGVHYGKVLRLAEKVFANLSRRHVHSPVHSPAHSPRPTSPPTSPTRGKKGGGQDSDVVSPRGLPAAQTRALSAGPRGSSSSQAPIPHGDRAGMPSAELGLPSQSVGAEDGIQVHAGDGFDDTPPLNPREEGDRTGSTSLPREANADGHFVAAEGATSTVEASGGVGGVGGGAGRYGDSHAGNEADQEHGGSGGQGDGNRVEGVPRRKKTRTRRKQGKSGRKSKKSRSRSPSGRGWRRGVGGHRAGDARYWEEEAKRRKKLYEKAAKMAVTAVAEDRGPDFVDDPTREEAWNQGRCEGEVAYQEEAYDEVNGYPGNGRESMVDLGGSQQFLQNQQQKQQHQQRQRWGDAESLGFQQRNHHNHSVQCPAAPNRAPAVVDHRLAGGYTYRGMGSIVPMNYGSVSKGQGEGVEGAVAAERLPSSCGLRPVAHHRLYIEPAKSSLQAVAEGVAAVSTGNHHHHHLSPSPPALNGCWPVRTPFRASASGSNYVSCATHPPFRFSKYAAVDPPSHLTRSGVNGGDRGGSRGGASGEMAIANGAAMVGGSRSAAPCPGATQKFVVEVPATAVVVRLPPSSNAAETQALGKSQSQKHRPGGVGVAEMRGPRTSMRAPVASTAAQVGTAVGSPTSPFFPGQGEQGRSEGGLGDRTGGGSAVHGGGRRYRPQTSSGTRTVCTNIVDHFHPGSATKANGSPHSPKGPASSRVRPSTSPRKLASRGGRGDGRGMDGRARTPPELVMATVSLCLGDYDDHGGNVAANPDGLNRFAADAGRFSHYTKQVSPASLLAQQAIATTSSVVGGAFERKHLGSSGGATAGVGGGGGNGGCGDRGDDCTRPAEVVPAGVDRTAVRSHGFRRWKPGESG